MKRLLLKTACGAQRTLSNTIVPLIMPMRPIPFDVPLPPDTRKQERRFRLMQLFRDGGTGEVLGGEYWEIVE